MIKRFKSENGKKLIYESYDRLLVLWGTHVEQKDIDTRFGKTHLNISGHPANPPLLLFHGVGDDSALMWIYNIGELSKNFYVIAVDTIGGPGKSEPNESYSSGFEQSVWIDDILDVLGLDRVYIAGVSNGAYLTQYYAMKRPHKVIRVVCMSGGIASKGSKSPIIRMMKVFLPEALFPTEKNTVKLMRKLCGPKVDVFLKNEELMLHWKYLLSYFNNRSMGFHKLITFEADEIASIRDRALFLIGECDPLSNHSDAENALKANNLNYKIIKDAGHGVNHEQSELVNREVIGFLLDAGA